MKAKLASGKFSDEKVSFYSEGFLNCYTVLSTSHKNDYLCFLGFGF
jgi:hypothetical protein